MDATYRQGLISALSCGFLWGVLPIYWKALDPIDSFVIIFYRIVLVALVCFALAYRMYGWKAMWEPLKNRKMVIRYLLAGILITANWSIYIWAVNSGFLIQTSIGYYIDPLLVCCFGLIFFKEELNGYKLAALLLAALSVAVIIIYYGELPLIALTLAFSFAIYAALKKNFQMPPALSLLYETVFLAPPALIAIFYMEATGQGALSVGIPWKCALLLLCGVFTATPLMLFADAANKISLFLLGVTEYISPTMALLIGIFLFKEPFDMVQLAAFIIIWIGLVIFSIGEFRQSRRSVEETQLGTEEE